jgi:arylsulfatase A-like enzyme
MSAVNIVFVLTDDQVWADLNTPMDPTVPVGGCAHFRTPNLDPLAREGMRFSDGYSLVANCTPTRRSIQFGLQAEEHPPAIRRLSG